MRSLSTESSRHRGRDTRTTPREDGGARATELITCFITTEAHMDESVSPPPDPPVSKPETIPPWQSNQSDADDSRRHFVTQPTCPSSPAPARSTSSSLWDLEEASSPDRSLAATPALSAISHPMSLLDSNSSERDSSACSLQGSRSTSAARKSLGLPPLDPPFSSAGADTVPQFVMPSLVISQRRPFTVVGKSLGKLKILVAGQNGVGKTAIIQAMTRSCEHFVHVDLIETAPTTNVVEVYASTKPHPWWRNSSDNALPPDDSERSQTIQSLDKNICIVDTPPIDTNRSLIFKSSAVKYVGSQIVRLRGKAIPEAELLPLLEHGMMPTVDAVLYMLPLEGPSEHDVVCLRDLQLLTNVIVLLAKSDKVADDEVEEAKQKIHDELVQGGIQCFKFTNADTGVYAVSSISSPNHEMMDASVLMSSTYINPLIASDLDKLTGRLLSSEGSAWLRASAATKTIACLFDKSSSLHLVLTHRARRKHNETSLIPISIQLQEQDRLVEVSNWALHLRQSLEAERVAYFSLPPPHIVEILSPNKLSVSKRDTSGNNRPRELLRPTVTTGQDPLGLLGTVSQLRQQSSVLLDLLTSLGAVGCLATLALNPYAASCTCDSILRALGVCGIH